MRKKISHDILSLFKVFQDDINTLPTYEKMYEEIRMMNFKIRPLNGDVSHIDLQDKRLLEALWRLGKLDEFFQREFDRLGPKEQEVFYRMFHTMYANFQEQLSKLSVRTEKITSHSSTIEIEIVKELPNEKKLN